MCHTCCSFNYHLPALHFKAINYSVIVLCVSVLDAYPSKVLAHLICEHRLESSCMHIFLHLFQSVTEFMQFSSFAMSKQNFQSLIVFWIHGMKLSSLVQNGLIGLFSYGNLWDGNNHLVNIPGFPLPHVPKDTMPRRYQGLLFSYLADSFVPLITYFM